MSATTLIRSPRTITLAGLLALSIAAQPALPSVGLAGKADEPAGGKTPCVINYIGHETDDQKTRVILHANGPIDYRGGSLRGNQVLIDIANVETEFETPVVELGAPEVDRVVIGPEITRENDRLLKVRLTGVRASSHKVTRAGNELHIDLKALKGARDGKGLPKVIDNKSEVMATIRGPQPLKVRFARAVPVGIQPLEIPASDPVSDPASVPASDPAPPQAVPGKPQKMIAVATSEPVVTSIVAAKAAPAISQAAMPQPVPAPQPATEPAVAPAATPAAASPATPAAAMAATVAPLAMPAAAPEASAERTLKVGVGRSLTLETAVPFTRVSVSNPTVAEPVAISPTQLLINGLAPGVVSLVLWPRQGTPIVYDLYVTIDTMALAQQIRDIFPAETVQIQTSKDSLVLSGSISSAAVADKIVMLAGDYSPKVVNHMTMPGTKRRQVLLKVRFAEVAKSAMTELGSVLHHVNPVFPNGDDRGTSGTGQFSPPRGNLLNDPVGPDLTWTDAINLSFFEKSIDLGLFITALKQRGLFQELAEPTLMAADGQEASFLAGGEFPVPVAQTGVGFISVTVVWKKFGISLDFKPTIVDDKTIVMHVKPEVSSLDFANAVIVEGFRIPALIVRRAETEVELQDGQSFAIAGLFDRNLLQTRSKVPILGSIPILGYLFRSKGLAKNQTELLVIVTPTLVEPMPKGAELPSLTMPAQFELDKQGRKQPWEARP